MTNINSRYGDFNNVADLYDKVRRELPDEVLDYFLLNIKKDRPRVLDVGCGTGLATRPLHGREADIIGVDRSSEMLTVARRHEVGAGIEYIRASAEKLPFDAHYFDAVIAVRAAHYFINDDAINEIKRVLKPGGAFFIVKQTAMKYLRDGIKDVLMPFIEEFPRNRMYNPVDILKQYGFTGISQKRIRSRECFDLDEAVDHWRSTSLWGLIPDKHENAAAESLRKYYESRLQFSIVVVPVFITMTIGFV